MTQLERDVILADLVIDYSSKLRQTTLKVEEKPALLLSRTLEN